MKQELGITVLLFAVLFLGMLGSFRQATLLLVIQIGLLMVLVLPFLGSMPNGELFGGMFLISPKLIIEKAIILGALYLVSLLFANWLEKQQHLAELFVLLMSAVLGMFFLLSADHLLLFWLGLELATIPLAAVVNLEVQKRLASEGAMKMILSSALASGVMLFGISLLYGVSGGMRFQELALALRGTDGLAVVGFAMVLAALAFKLSVVPFHFWTADVYQGASMPVAAVLSVASKGAAAFVLTTLMYRVFTAFQAPGFYLLAILAVLTMVLGNLFALRQRVFKRFLAFSSIAQVGFILVAIAGKQPIGEAAVIYFVLIYVFANLTAFSVASLMEQTTDGEIALDHFKGMYQRHPTLTWVMALALFSLAGIPPTAGFFAKLFLLQASAASGAYWLVAVAGLNMILSLFYYLRIVRFMFMEQHEPGTSIHPIAVSPATRLGLVLCLAGLLLAGVWSWVYDYLGQLV